MKDVFTRIFRDNEWKDDESVSGHGSTLGATEVIRRELPKLFAEFHMKSLLDIPCGDMNWIAGLLVDENFEYIGADIVPELIDQNINKNYPSDNIQFRVLDITRDELPKVDMILVRDLLGHFSDVDLALAINNIKRSGAKYLLATTFPSAFNTVRIQTGQWRGINLDYYCGLPPSIRMINEGNQMFRDKCLGLWQLR
jgi:2-polyprenyl-3-methyl-5-hydroxy-6-metoxy-1,4-benzoquinol methylase